MTTDQTAQEILEGIKRHRQAIVQTALWILLGIILLGTALNAVQLGLDASFISSQWPNLAFLGVLGLALLLNRYGQLKPALWLVVVLLLAASTYTVLTLGTSQSAMSLLIYFVPVVLAGLLMGRFALYFAAGIAITAGFLGEYLAATGNLLTGAEPMEPNWPVAAQFALVMGVVAFFLDRFGSSLEGALRAMVEREVALRFEVSERRLAQERLNLALTAARMATFETDAATQYVRGSPQLEALYGLPQQGRPRLLQDYISRVHPEDRNRLKEGLSAHSGEERRTEFRITTGDDETRWLVAVTKSFADEAGAPDRFVGVVADMTDTKKAQQTLERLNETLEERVNERTRSLEAANKELETFAYSVSHDLRAPLRGIGGFSQILLDDYADVLDDTGKSHLERIRSAADRMGELIDDLLNLSRLAGGQLDRSEVDLGNLARQIAQDLNERFRSTQVASTRSEVDLQVDGEVVAKGDPQLLRIVLENLLGNAWKFMGDQPDPRVELGVTESEAGRTYYVRDNGSGFEMAYAEKIFLPFQRLQATMSEGTGIGLATVQRAILRHEGRIWAESSPGRGATFHFTLGEDGGFAAQRRSVNSIDAGPGA